MTGLDNILRQIKSESDAAVSKILAKAETEANAIVTAAREEAKAQCDRISERSTSEVQDTLNRARSAAALQKRKAILAEKQKLISETIEQAKQKLYSLPEAQYFSIILKMAEKFTLPQSGEILFSEKDLNRLPKDFESTLNSAVKEKGSVLKISPETRRIDGGFVLSYGGIEENCSFEALFDSAHDTLQDKVHELLFS